MEIEDIWSRYSHEEAYLRQARDEWELRLLGIARQVDAGVLVSGRIKSYRSTLGKLRRKPGKTFDDLGDLVAFKAIFPTPQGVDEFTEHVMDHDSWSPRLETKKCAPHELKYQSNQFDLASREITDSRGRPLQIEVQARTAVVDAWYVIDHRFQYKTFVGLNDDMKRRLNRLIVLTEVFDQEVREVAKARRTLPEFEWDRVYEILVTESERLTDGHTSTIRPEGLLTTIREAYSQDEKERVSALIEEFVDKHFDRLRDIFHRHLSTSPDYVESRDWLYQEPEAVIIAERAVAAPRLLTSVVEESNYSREIGPMVAEFEALRA